MREPVNLEANLKEKEKKANLKTVYLVSEGVGGKRRFLRERGRINKVSEAASLPPLNFFLLKKIRRETFRLDCMFTINGASRRAEKSRKVLMMRGVEFGWARAG